MDRWTISGEAAMMADLWINKAHTDRVTDQACRIVNIQPVHQACPMSYCRFECYSQDRSYLLGALSCRDEFENLTFPFR